MKYEVKTYGNPVLRKKAVPVVKVDSAIKQIVKDMIETMYSTNGLGLAAEQVGRTESICVIDVPASVDVDKEGGARQNPGIKMPVIMINPEITAMEGAQTGQEGCLSFPEIFVSVKRAESVTVCFTNLTGKKEILWVKGLFARTVQHEVDHLNGVLLVDRMGPVQKIANAGKLKKLKKQNKE